MVYRAPRPVKKSNDNFDMTEKLICAATYLSTGLVGFIWLIINAIKGKQLRPYMRFHIYQSIFLSILIYLFYLILNIIMSVIKYIPLIKDIAGFIIFYVAQYPIFLGFSALQSVFIIASVYLAWMAYIGKTVEIPWVTKTVKGIM